MFRLRSTLFALLLPALLAFTATASAQEPVLEVRGRLIDIRPVAPGAEAYPQYKQQRFPRQLPERLEGLSCAVSLREFEGPSAIRADRACDLLAGLNAADPDTTLWRSTGETLLIGKTRYTLYTARYQTPGQWMTVPAPQAGGASTLLFAKRLRVVETTPLPGVVVARSPNLHKSFITNPNIVILPDGSYLAACTGPSSPRGAVFFRSEDRGKSWSRWSEGVYPVNFYSVFLHRGALYMMGTSSPGGNVVICRSDDSGRTWSFPRENDQEGILLRGRYHSAPVPVVVHEGRIWRAMETNTSDQVRKAFVLSAPVDADLMQASSWTASDELASYPEWISDSDDRGFRQWIEGNVVITPDGKLANLLRVDEHKYGCSAALVHIRSPHRLDFDPKTDILDMPGGGKKFTIRFDSLSCRYWALTSIVREPFRGMKHGGIYASGIHCGLIRNTLALISSADLRDWRTERIVMASDNPFFDGFQYADWQFDGDDIVAVVRTAIEEARGLPVRQHDANYLLFKRIERFRTPAADAEPIRTLHKP